MQENVPVFFPSDTYVPMTNKIIPCKNKPGAL